jgi:hypothetical protein
MASDDDVLAGLKRYIGGMLDYGVSGRDIHFVVSSGAAKAENTQKIKRALQKLNYQVNQVSAEQEGTLGLKSVLPKEFEDNSFVVDIGSGNTKISWKENGQLKSVETYGSKYFQENVDDQKVYNEVKERPTRCPATTAKPASSSAACPSKWPRPCGRARNATPCSTPPTSTTSTTPNRRPG